MPQPRLGDYVGGVTSYCETKGLNILLEAWAKGPPAGCNPELKFYGAGPDREELLRMAERLGVRAQFNDAVLDASLAFKELRCFVLPSRIEGLPLALLEALAMDIPVVSSALPGTLEFNRLARQRGSSVSIPTFKSEDPEDLARVLAAVLANPAGRRRAPTSTNIIRPSAAAR